MQHDTSQGPVLFISDMHLDDERPAIIELFRRFLIDQGRQAQAVYMLGDLFEAWIGDDAVDPSAPALAAIRELSDSGVPVYVMRGNRDFLLGDDFAAMTGTQLLADPTRIEIDGAPVALMHGDAMCIDDVEYQQFRAMVRDPQWQAAFLAKPIDERLAMAGQARGESTERNASTEDYLMDVNPDEVARTFEALGVARMIHGHTHRPAVHMDPENGFATERIVRGDWYDHGSVLRVSDGVFDLQSIPIG